ncbi:MAG: FAD-dependent monooxygenase [Acidobacteria bacterium]|nr:FAD-dependent monooxygenase [Acidobacteriota bacterium]
MSPLDPLAARYDVVVVGARAAGAATAMLLARQGLRVLAVDRGRYGADTLSTHALMRGGVLQLHRWGLLDRVRASGAPTVSRTTFHYGEDTFPVEIRPADGIDGLYAPRRSVLDSILVDAAVAAGARVVHCVRMTRLLRGFHGRVQGVELEADDGSTKRVRATWVIGADGVRSRVAREAGARTERIAHASSGVVYGYSSGLDLDGYHWHYAPGVSAGVIPTNGGSACIFASMPSHRFLGEVRWDLAAGYDRVLEEVSPALAAAVRSGRKLESLRGFPGEPGHLRQAWGPGWALVGDAGYFKDPITAHGLTDALRDAELLACAIGAGTESALFEYQQRRDELSVDLFEGTERIARYDWTLEQVQELHRSLSDAMKGEVRALRALDCATRPAERRSA